MGRRRVDSVEIQSVETGGKFDNFTSFSLTMDMSGPSEASFELGNSGTWADIERFILPGSEYKVTVNGRPFLTGRVEMDDIPLDARGGSVVRLTVRTRMADAFYASANTKIKVKDTTLKRFLVNLYEPLGYSESDFIGLPATARDLLTGRSSAGKGNFQNAQIEKAKVQDAKISSGETIYDAADRHLRRFGLMHWDSPDGKIVIGAPNDEQDPLYNFAYGRTTNGLNNVLGITRTIDYSAIPSFIYLYGSGRTIDGTRKPVVGKKVDDDLVKAGFYRPTILEAKSIRTNALAERAVNREYSARAKQKDNHSIELDGLSFWDGFRSIPFSIDTVCTINSDVLGGQLGRYYVHRVTLSRDARQGDRTNITALKSGIWRL